MADFTRGQTFGVTEQVTNTKLHNLVDNATISNIVNLDISDSAAINDLKLDTITRSNKVSGTSLFNLASIPASAGLIPQANVSIPTSYDNFAINTLASITAIHMVNSITEISTDGTLAGDSDSAVPTEKAVKTYVDSIDAGGKSNVIFSWSGFDGYSSGVVGFMGGTSTTPAIAGEYSFFAAGTTTPRTVLRFKFKKISSISTITIYARLWANTTGATAEAICTVDIGGQSNTAKSITSTTPTWYAGSGTIDVSGLSDGTVYDGIVQLSNEDNDSGTYVSYLSGITLIGS